MILDSSALVAIAFGEAEAEDFLVQCLRHAPRISAANYFEAAMVIDRKSLNDIPPRVFAEVIDHMNLEVVSVSRLHAESARAAYRRFGKGNHPARLNFGDCFAYALAQETGEPLLFKGDDFVLTDVKAAV